MVRESPGDELLGFLLNKDKALLSAEEKAWIQRYLDLADEVLEPEMLVMIKRDKQGRSWE